MAEAENILRFQAGARVLNLSSTPFHLPSGRNGPTFPTGSTTMKRASLIAISFLFTLACGGDKVPTVAPAPVVVTPTSVSVSVSPLIQTIPPGQTARLSATARYSDGSTKDVTSQATWTSSQANVATVAAGAVTGIALGR